MAAPAIDWFNLSNEMERVSSSTAFSRRGTPARQATLMTLTRRVGSQIRMVAGCAQVL